MIAPRLVGVLSSKPETGDEGLVPRDTLLGQVVEEPPALAYELQQATTSGEVMAMDLQVRREVGDSPGVEGYLNLCGPGVSLVGVVFLDYLPFGVFVQASSLWSVL